MAADLLREQATGPVPLGPAAPGQGEDVILLVETASLPDEPGALSPGGMPLGDMDLGAGSPWYRSRWLYVGAGLAGGTALAAAAVLLLRKRPITQRRTALSRAQNILTQWPKLGEQTARLTRQISKPTRQTTMLSGQMSRLAEQAGDITNQAQRQLSRFTGRTQGARLTLVPLQRQSRPNRWMKQTRRQLTNLSQQAGGQLSAIGNSIGGTTTQAIGKTQESLAQMRQGVAAGAAKTGEGMQRGWKLSRNFTLGMTAGAIWAAFFTPESGESTRQRLTTIFQIRQPRRR
jgi:gas vesicle protein